MNPPANFSQGCQISIMQDNPLPRINFLELFYWKIWTGKSLSHDSITEANGMSLTRLAHINECRVKMGPRERIVSNLAIFFYHCHTILSWRWLPLTLPVFNFPGGNDCFHNISHHPLRKCFETNTHGRGLKRFMRWKRMNWIKICMEGRAGLGLKMSSDW